MIIQHGNPATFGSAAYIQVSDVKGTIASTRFTYWSIKAAPEPLILDFSDCPRLFEGEQIDLFSSYGFPINEFIFVSMYGWEEQA